MFRITSCDHLQGGVLRRTYYKASKPVNKYKILSIKYLIHKRWPKHVRILQCLECNKFIYFPKHLLDEIFKLLSSFTDLIQRRKPWALISADKYSLQNLEQPYAVNISRLITKHIKYGVYCAGFKEAHHQRCQRDIERYLTTLSKA